MFISDSDVALLGEQLNSIHDAVNGSKLAAFIKAISTDPALITGIAISSIVNELLGVIGKIMKQNKDDFVDLFEGSYGTDREQETKTKKIDTEACGIEYELRTSPL